MGMVSRIAVITFLTAGAAVAVLCFVWPMAIALVEVLAAERWAGAGLGPRRLQLLWSSVCIAVGSAVLAQALGAGLATGLVAGGRARARTAWVCLLVLLTPPYVYAYAWSLLLLPGGVIVGAEGAVKWPAWLVHQGRAIWCLGTWASPVAAAVLACGWRASGRPAFALALSDASSRQAFLRAALPAMAPWLANGMIATGLLSITEHTVCDLCQTPTWNTEVMAAIQLSSPGQGTPGSLLAWPLVALVGLLLLALWPFRARFRRLLTELSDWRTADEVAGDGRRSSQRWSTMAVTLVLLLPWLILATQFRDIGAMRSMWAAFPREWPDGVLCAAGSALLSVWLAITVDALLTRPTGSVPRLLRVAVYSLFALAAIAALSPPALIGDAFAAAYLPWPWLSDHWPIVSLVTAARFALIPMLALRLAGRHVGPELSGAAAMDGAGWVSSYVRVRLPLCLPTLLLTGLIVGLLSLTEVPATHLVRPAGVESVAITLFNQIHYGRNDEIVAMSLYLMVCVAAVVTVTTLLPLRAHRTPR